jgi:hypothetical protein
MQGELQIQYMNQACCAGDFDRANEMIDNGQKVILVGFSTRRQRVGISLFIVVFLKKVPRSIQLQE